MNRFQCYSMVLVLAMLAFALPVQVQGVTLDETGTDTCSPGYVCNDGAFKFDGMHWYKPGKAFSVDFTHQCSAVCLQQYMPGWGGGGVTFQAVKIHGEYDYDNGATYEKITHNGQIIIEERMTCAKNPWAHGTCAGWSQAAIFNKVTINGRSVTLDPPYPLSVRYMPGDLFMALHNWDKNKDAPDPLADWDPYGTPGGYSSLKITTPTNNQIIGEHTASFTLTLQNLPATSQKVLMVWQRAQELPEWQGDIHIQPGTYDWFPFTGPSETWSTSFPLTVAVEPGFFAGKPGHYRVQVKLSNETWWSAWKYFWIGQPTYDSQKLLKGNAAMIAMKKKSISTKMATGQVKIMGAEGTKAQGTIAAPMTVKIPVVIVDSVSYKPVPTKPGNTVDLIVNFKNKGQANSSANLKYVVSCVVKSGGPTCAVANNTYSINKSIPAGQTYQLTLTGSSPAVTGKFEVTVKPEGGSTDSGKTITIDVGPKIEATKVKAIKKVQ